MQTLVAHLLLQLFKLESQTKIRIPKALATDTCARVSTYLSDRNLWSRFMFGFSLVLGGQSLQLSLRIKMGHKGRMQCIKAGALILG